MIRLFFFYLYLLHAVFTLTSCNSSSSSKITNSENCSRNLSQFSASEVSSSEIDLCTNIRTFSQPVVIIGSAFFQARKIDTSSNPVGGLLDPGDPEPIRYAEIIILDQEGNQIQCGQTESDGSFSIEVPSNFTSNSIRIMARADNEFIKTSVKVCFETKEVYSLNADFVPDKSQDLGQLIAPATGSLLGGAFNIYDQVLKANDFLRSKVSNCSSTYLGCKDFNVAPKSNIYWEKGFNPNRYFSSDKDQTSSFYLPSNNQLFILGGVDGDVGSSDTDHFDNSVILHEYGHFLENMYYTSDSPGGFHSGTNLLDPRLAWSEGWGNFFQGAVSNEAYYVDTFGNNSQFTQDIFRINLEDQSSGVIDSPCLNCGSGSSHVKEGNFREFTITRALWDILDDADDGENISNSFDQIWASITSTNKGFNEDNFLFKSVGGFYERREALITASSASVANWSDIISLHEHVSDRSNYALWLTEKADTSSCSSGSFSITPTNRLSNNIKISSLSSGTEADAYIAFSSNFFQYLNPLHNSNFYHFYHFGGQANLTLIYNSISGTTNADLDYYLYRDVLDGNSYVLGEIDYLISPNQGVTEPNASFGSQQIETINISNLEAGHYMINVLAFYDNPNDEFDNTTTFELKINSGSGERFLCPTSFPN